mmetsp:Transcript_158870/g.509412  ORF Transcript_158870/g.509412 Transcript_158870/m.509412 type:complete len:322 (-) Transcript_158870:50-1015(-)
MSRCGASVSLGHPGRRKLCRGFAAIVVTVAACVTQTMWVRHDATERDVAVATGAAVRLLPHWKGRAGLLVIRTCSRVGFCCAGRGQASHAEASRSRVRRFSRVGCRSMPVARRESLRALVGAAAVAALAPPPARALVPEPEALEAALLEVQGVLRLLEDPTLWEEPSDAASALAWASAARSAPALASGVARSLRRSLPVVGEMASAVYVRQSGPTVIMMLQMLRGEQAKQSLSPIDVERLEALEALTEEAIAAGDALARLAAPPGDGAELLRAKIRGILRQLLCELDCVATRTPDGGGWAGCLVDQSRPPCRGAIGVSDPR